MTASQSLRLYELTLEFIKDKEKAKEYITKIEETVEEKIKEKQNILATKQDLAETKVDIIKWLVGTGIAIVGLVVGLVKLF